SLPRRPLISILAEVSSAEPSVLDRLVRSVAEQIYPAWELAIAAPVRRQGEVGSALSARGVVAGRLRMVNAGANSAESLNALLAVSEGEYVLPLKEGSLLRPHALLDLALTIGRAASAELFYSDEDRIDAAGNRGGWRFKPAWSPNLLEAWDYLGQLTLMRRETVRALGGW